MFGQAMMDADHLPHTLLTSNAFSRGMPDSGASSPMSCSS